MFVICCSQFVRGFVPKFLNEKVAGDQLLNDVTSFLAHAIFIFV